MENEKNWDVAKNICVCHFFFVLLQGDFERGVFEGSEERCIRGDDSMIRLLDYSITRLLEGSIIRGND